MLLVLSAIQQLLNFLLCLFLLLVLVSLRAHRYLALDVWVLSVFMLVFEVEGYEDDEEDDVEKVIEIDLVCFGEDCEGSPLQF